MENPIRKYLSEIGRRGGLAGKRSLSAEEAREMVRVREARRAYKKFYTRCFWSYPPDLKITAADVTWVAEQLRKQGGREAWEKAAQLCP